MNRNARRAKAAAAVFVPHDHPNFEPESRASARLERELATRIFSPAAASATDGWTIPAFGINAPPTTRNPLGHADYAFQKMVDGRPRNWAWVTQNVTLFYQAPDDSPFYLRAKSSVAGVDQDLWKSVFPEARQVPTQFRTFELIDVTDRNRFNADNHLDDTVYFEVDLASRAPRGHIDIQLEEDYVLDNLTFELLDLLETMADLQAEMPDDLNPLVRFAYVLLEICVSAGEPIIFENPEARITLTFDVMVNAGQDAVILSETVIFRPENDVNEMENVRMLGLKLLHLLWEIYERLMEAHYDDNGAHVFHPRTIRLVLREMPETEGEVYRAPPRGLVMPRGGCMAVNGMPKSLMLMLSGLVVSHDIYQEGVFFDNNCGIRELLVSLGLFCSRPGDVKSLYDAAARMRADTPNLPAFIKLGPEDLARVIGAHLGDNLMLYIFELPSPEQPLGMLWHYEPEEPSNDFNPIYLILSHGHYFGLRARHQMERLIDFKSVASIRFCCRCKRYCKVGDSRVAHDFETPSPMYPACHERVKATRKLPDWPDYLPPPKSNPNALRAVQTTPKFLDTPAHRIGFMDFETWRPEGMEGYHEVYAVGWIKTASWTVTRYDVMIYSALEDPEIHNGALIHAFVDLIAFLSSQPDVYSRKKPYYLYFYNGAGFDNIFILNTLASHFKLYPDDMSMKEGRILTMSYLDGTLVIRDLCLFTLCSLKEACKIYGVDGWLAKGDFNHNLITSVESIREHWEEIAVYLAKDLTALCMVFMKFKQASYEIFKLDVCKRITASHLAYDYWNTTLNANQRCNVIIPASFDLYQDVLKSFYGGRVYPCVKFWQSEDSDLHYNDIQSYLVALDVVSLYPSVMFFSERISNLFFEGRRNVPVFFTGEPTFIQGPGSRHWDVLEEMFKTSITVESQLKPSMFFWQTCNPDFALLLDQAGAIVCVDVQPCRYLPFPVLPHKDAKGNTAWDLQFHEKQCYVLEELLDAIFFGYKVTKLHWAYIYPHRDALFDVAMDTLMEGKNSCARGDPKREIYKTSANSVYGKHAQKAIVEETSLVAPGQLHQVFRDKFVLTVEPICNREFAPRLKEARLNRPMWINDDPDAEMHVEEQLVESLEVEDYVAPVDAFVVKSKPDSILPTKPTHLGAQVTAYARIHMNFFAWLFKIHCPSADIRKQLFYTDTDSNWVHKSIIDDVAIAPKTLGMLDDELEGGKVITFVALAPKTYACTYVMPDNSRKMKIRCKGFPHTKETLDFYDTPIDLDVRPREQHWHDGTLHPELLDLGKRVYECKDAEDNSTFYHYLSPTIFESVLNKTVTSVTVHFTSMRRAFFGAHAFGHVSGIKHCHLQRSLQGAPWWNGTETDPHPHRKENPDYPGVTFPLGHALLQ